MEDIYGPGNKHKLIYIKYGISSNVVANETKIGYIEVEDYVIPVKKRFGIKVYIRDVGKQINFRGQNRRTPDNYFLEKSELIPFLSMIRQHGVRAYTVFNEEGKILIINTVGNWQLPGGKPESEESWEEALIREVAEEADVEIKNIIPVGYQIVSEIKEGSTLPQFIQLRYLATIEKLNEPTPDPATGKIPERKFINPSDFSKYCPWGNIGQYVVDKASKIFHEKIKGKA